MPTCEKAGRRQVVALVFLSCSAPTARARLLRSAHASGGSPWGTRSMPHAAGFLHAFERGGHRRWGASSDFSAEYVAVSAEGIAHLPMGLDDALELQRGQAVVIHGAAGGALCSTRVRCCRAGFAFFPSRSSFSDKRLHGDQRPARQSPRLHP
jgi:hypothetical protein